KESLCQYLRNFGGVGNLIVPFCDRRGDIDDVGFLKGVGAEQTGKYLAGNANKRVAINHCIGKTCNQIGCAWSARSENNAHPPRCACIALRRMNSSLLMAHEYMLQPVVIILQGIIDWYDRSSALTVNSTNYCINHGH